MKTIVVAVIACVLCAVLSAPAKPKEKELLEQILNSPEFQCRPIIKGIEPGEWTSGNCAEAVVALKLYSMMKRPGTEHPSLEIALKQREKP